MAEESRSTQKSGPSRGMFVSLIVVFVVVIGTGAYLWKGMQNSTPLSPTPSEIPNFMVDTQQSATDSAMTNIQVTFTCADGKIIEATFNNSTDGSADLTLSDGRIMSLPIEVSENNARYVSEDESVVLFAQENGLLIEENGIQTYSECTPETPTP